MLSDLDDEELEEIESRLYSQIYYANESTTQETDTSATQATPLQYSQRRYFKRATGAYIPYNSPMALQNSPCYNQNIPPSNQNIPTMETSVNQHAPPKNQPNRIESEIHPAQNETIPEYININENSADSGTNTDYQINPMCVNKNVNNETRNTIMDLFVGNSPSTRGSRSVNMFKQFIKKKSKADKQEKQAKIWNAANDAELFRTLSLDERKAVLKYQKRQRYKERKKLRMLEKNLNSNQNQFEKSDFLVDSYSPQLLDIPDIDIVSISGSDGSSIIAIETQHEVLVISDSESELNIPKDEIKENVDEEHVIKELSGEPEIKDAAINDDVIFVEKKEAQVIDLDCGSSSQLTATENQLNDSELMKPPDFETLSVCSVSSNNQSFGASTSKLTPKKTKPAVSDSTESTKLTPKKISRERDELLSTPESNDFLDNTLSGEENFNFSLHGTDFETSKTTPNKKTFADICESESSCSASDISAPVKSIVFNEIEFDTPSKELFSENNLDSFSDFITPKRTSTNLLIAPLLTPARELFEQVQTKALCRSVSDDENSSSSESDYDVGKAGQVGVKNLPDLSHFEKDTPTKTNDKKKKCAKDKKKKKNKASEAENDEEINKKNKRESTPKRTKSIEGNISEEEITKKKKNESSTKKTINKNSEENLYDDANNKDENKKKKPAKINKNIEESDNLCYESNKEETKRKRKCESTPKRITEDLDDSKKKKKNKEDESPSPTKRIKKKKRIADEWLEDDDNYKESTATNTSSHFEFEEETHSQFPDSGNKVNVPTNEVVNVSKTKKGARKNDTEDKATEETSAQDSSKTSLEQETSEGTKTTLEQENSENQEKPEGARKRRTSDKRNPDAEGNDVEEEDDKRKRKSNDSRKTPEKETPENQEGPEKSDGKRKRRTSDKRNPEEISVAKSSEDVVENAEVSANNDGLENHKRKRKTELVETGGEKVSVEHDKLDSKKRKKSPSKNNHEETENVNKEQNEQDKSAEGKRRRKFSDNISKKNIDEADNEVESNDNVEEQNKTNEITRKRKSSETTTKNVEPTTTENVEVNKNPVEPELESDNKNESDSDSDVEIIEKSFEVIDVEDSESEAESDSVTSTSSSGFEYAELDKMEGVDLANLVGHSKKKVHKNKGKSGSDKLKGLSELLQMDMKEFYNNSFGAEKFDVEDLQKSMSDNPNNWKILERDRIHLAFDRERGPRCRKCRQIGHLAVYCTEKPGPPICCLCGEKGHYEPRCPNKVCTQCGRSCFETTVFCSKCVHLKQRKCSICKMKGHISQYCPDIWRRYHLTTEDGPVKKCRDGKVVPKNKRWCSGCGSSGHLEYMCDYCTREHPPVLPQIVKYTDVYGFNKKQHLDVNRYQKQGSADYLKANNAQPSGSYRIEMNVPGCLRGTNVQPSGSKDYSERLVKTPPQATMISNCNTIQSENRLRNPLYLDKQNAELSNIRSIENAVIRDCILFTEIQTNFLRNKVGVEFLANLELRFNLPLTLIQHERMGLSCIYLTAKKELCIEIKKQIIYFLHGNAKIEDRETYLKLRQFLEYLAVINLEENSAKADAIMNKDVIALNAFIFGVKGLEKGKEYTWLLIDVFEKYDTCRKMRTGAVEKIEQALNYVFLQRRSDLKYRTMMNFIDNPTQAGCSNFDQNENTNDFLAFQDNPSIVDRRYVLKKYRDRVPTHGHKSTENVLSKTTDLIKMFESFNYKYEDHPNKFKSLQNALRNLSQTNLTALIKTYEKIVELERNIKNNIRFEKLYSSFNQLSACNLTVLQSIEKIFTISITVLQRLKLAENIITFRRILVTCCKEFLKVLKIIVTNFCKFRSSFPYHYRVINKLLWRNIHLAFKSFAKRNEKTTKLSRQTLEIVENICKNKVRIDP